jgi:hypothetical protein
MSEQVLELDDDLEVTAADLIELKGPRWCSRFVTELRHAVSLSIEEQDGDDQDQELDFSTEEEW